MKQWTEGKAAWAAGVVSVATLIGILGFARLMSHVGLAQVAAPTDVSRKEIGVGLTVAAETGRHLFLMNCAHCHGDDARGDEGPDLHDLHKSDNRIREVITAGIKGEMPSFQKKLNESDVRALTEYLRTLRS